MIDPSARVAASAHVGEGVEIGADTEIGEEAALGRSVRLGAGCSVGPGAWIGEDVTIGDRVEIGHQALILGDTMLEDDTFVGAGAVLNGQHDPRSARWLAERTAPGFHVGRPDTPRERPSGVWLRSGASVGAGAVVLGGVTVGRFGMVRAGAIVGRDVPGHALVAGNPAERVGWSCRCGTQLLDADGHPVPAEPAHYARDRMLRCPACGRVYAYLPEEQTLEERRELRSAAT